MVRQVIRCARGRLTDAETEVVDAYLGKLAGRGRSPGYVAGVRSAGRSLSFTAGRPLVDVSDGQVSA